MAALVSALRWAKILRALLHAQHAVFLGLTILITVIAADAPVADEPLLDSAHNTMGFLGDIPSPTGSSLSALLNSHYTTFETPESPGAPSPMSQPTDGDRTTDTALFKPEVNTHDSKSQMPVDVLKGNPGILTTPLSKTSQPSLASAPRYEASAKLSTDSKMVRTDSNFQASSHPPISTSSDPSLQRNTAMTSSSPTAFRKSTPHLVLHSVKQAASSEIQDSHSNQTLPIRTFRPSPPLEPPILAFSDSLANKSYGQMGKSSQLSPSIVAMENKPAPGINMLPDEIPSPGHHVPFITPHHATPLSEPTDLSPEDYYPTNTMDVDWGSGDYLETMSFYNSDGDPYSLVTKVPSDPFDLQDYTESYDTSFPSRVGISPSSLNPLQVSATPSLLTTSSTIVPLKSVNPSTFSTSALITLEPTQTPSTDISVTADIDWADTFTIQPTDVLLPDMNSLEYYTTQLTKENSTGTGAEHGGDVTVVSINATEMSPSTGFTSDTNLTEEESSGDLSGFEVHDESTPAATTEESPHLVNISEPFLAPSIVPTHFFETSSSIWGGQVSTDWAAHTSIVGVDTAPAEPSATPVLPEDVIPSSSLTDVHWFVTDSVSESSTHTTPVLSATTTFSPSPTEPAANDTAGTTDPTSPDPTFATEQPLNTSSASTDYTWHNVTLVPPVMLGDEGVTEDGDDIPATMTLMPASSEVNTLSSAPTTTTATTTPHQATTGAEATTEASTTVGIISTTTEMTTAMATTARQYLCRHDRPAYLTKIGFPSGATVGYAKTQIRDILKGEFNKSVELQVVDPPPRFVFRVVSGPIVYSAISVINALRRSGRRFLSVSPNLKTPDRKFQVHTVLQFVPGHIDVRYCNFSESVERGLTMAFAEVRRRSKGSTNVTVHIVNVTMASPKYEEQRLVSRPVDITFAVSGSRGYLMGSEVSNALMKFTVVEFSYYMGFPVLQIAEPFHYPELNTSHLLRSSWVRTVLLGVLQQKAGERTFQANIERRVAMLLGEAMGQVRRVKRATAVGNSSVQVVSAGRLVGADHPLEIVYFAEGPSGERMPAVHTSNLLNSLDVQRAAIILGYRVQGILAQPFEKVASPPSETENSNIWIVVGVVIPLLVVIVIISILYWKLCRTDKLEFQPDAMTSIQQRQKLQTPTVKGFDFAKLHLGQQSKDDVMVIQEPGLPGLGSGPLPISLKDGLCPSENGEILTPKSKTSASSMKASRSGRRRERISPSDGDSVVSDHSSERESTEENLRVQATPSDSKQTRKVPINVLNGPPPLNGAAKEPQSSAAIFEHVDRISRTTDASRRLPNKVQLIAMQPMPVPPLHSPPINSKMSDTNQINKEIQVALRHKSEIEHHRNKIRLRAKRKGHYDFPAMEDMVGGLGDSRDQDQIYQKAQTQINKILEPDTQMPSMFMEPKKSGRGRRSPKQRLKDQLNGGMREADKDHLITEDIDAYRKCPGVNNVAYVSDPDQGPGSPHRSPSPTDDVFLGPASSPPGHAPPPPPYMPPQPSIEEARQQMHSLLDDAFALVSPTSQGSTAGITLPGVNSNPQCSSPPGRGPRGWGPSYQTLGPLPGRFSELGMSSTAVQGLTPRQGLGSSYLPPGETAGHGEQLQPDSLFSSRGLYADELPSSARPRPVGGTTGAQLHHLTQVGLSSRMNGYPAGVRAAPGQNGGAGWNHFHDDHFSKAEPERDVLHRSGMRDPTAPPTHFDSPGVGYVTSPQPLDTSPPIQSSASLIKAIREELLRLSQKQASVPSYHS
ncbi:UPF0606 protein KIAA1549 isoform 2-T2 [Menidia menidia]